MVDDVGTVLDTQFVRIIPPRGCTEFCGEHAGDELARDDVQVALLVEGDVERDRDGDRLDKLPEGDSEPERDLILFNFFGIDDELIKDDSRTLLPPRVEEVSK